MTFFLMECSTSGNDLDMKDELTKIKHKLMNELKKMDTNFKYKMSFYKRLYHNK